jgi:hypothetical protein
MVDDVKDGILPGLQVKGLREKRVSAMISRHNRVFPASMYGEGVPTYAPGFVKAAMLMLRSTRKTVLDRFDND